MGLPINRNITIYQGDTFEMQFRLRAKSNQGDPGAYVDLTGAEGKAQIRSTEDSTTVLAEFDVACAADGTVTLTLTPAQTADPALTSGLYDVQILFADGAIKTYLRGSVTVTKEVTRA